MKKILAVLFAASMMLVGTKASAQSWTAAGGFTTFSLSGADVKGSFLKDVPSIPGFYFGVNYDYAFSTIDGLTVEPGAYIMHYGKEYSFGISPASKSYHANYLRVPVNIKYTMPVNSSFDLCLFTGPRFNLGIGGNMFGKGENYMGLKLTDAQWGIGVSALLAEAVMIRAGYDLGLTRCIKDNTALGFDNLKVYRNTAYVGVGFAF